MDNSQLSCTAAFSGALSIDIASMETFDVRRPDGSVSRYVNVDGLTYPERMVKTRFPNNDLRSHMKTVRDMQVREDDIFVCTFPKSGTHWVLEIISMLLRGKAEYEGKSKEAGVLDFNTEEQNEAIPSPRIFCTHFPLDYLPREIMRKRCKIIHVQRNPKDVAVSYYHHAKNLKHYSFEDSFSQFLPLITGKHGFYLHYSWFKYVQDWETFTKQNTDLPVLNIYYEDLKQNSVREVEKVAEFLGKSPGKQLCLDIATKCQFQNLKAAAENISDDPIKGLSVTGATMMYRKGEVADWKNWFTVAESEEFDKIYANEMSGSSLTFKYELQ